MANIGALIDAVELSYDAAAASDAAWLRRLGDALAPALAPRAMEAWFSDAGRAEPVAEAAGALALHAGDVDGHGPHLLFVEPAHAPSAAQLEHVVAHVIAAARLRRYGGWLEAVLTPAGALCHAEGEAIYMREELREAARTMDRARTRLRVTSPEDALAGWRVLVEARWSLLDMTDSDGKRLVVARVNPPRTRSSSEVLGAREQQVLALAGRGHTNRLIAYELGLSIGTVEADLAAALRKLGACA